MSNVKKLLMSGASGGELLNVENVFSTHLWEGTGSPPAINNGIALADSANGNTGSSTEFDGNSDALNKSSDLTGNADGKTFTVSFWINPTDDTNTGKTIYHTNGTWKNIISYGTNGTVFVAFFQNASSGGTVFELQNPDIRLGFGGWNHVIFSADMTDTNKRHLYINDQAASATYTHTNNNIDFTRTQHAIGDDLSASTGNLHGYLAHFFLDYTYRDLSVESNRRTFIDSARGSTSVSTLSALNPIIYLPMTSGYSVGENEGTGGDFSAVSSPTIVTDNGTEAESGIGQGGMVWYRRRDGAENNSIEDTVRGLDKVIYTDSTNAEADPSIYGLQAFNSNGFTAGINTSGGDYVSWTFRKASKFFDIVTFSGNSTNRTISHNLGTAPGFMIVKRTSSSGTNWMCFHRSVGATKGGILNGTNSFSTDSTTWNDTAPTSSVFSLGTDGNVNKTGHDYVAYLFAHNNSDGGFGPDGDADIIKCGTYNGTGSAGNEINLGFEPQWLMIKRTNASSDWVLFDTMRGLTNGGQNEDRYLYPNSSGAEGGLEQIAVTPTGFITEGSWGEVNNSSGTYIYVAIRRGPMAAPTSRSQVFEVDAVNTSATPNYVSGFPVDMLIEKGTGGSNTRFYDRQRGMNQMYADSNGFTEGTGRGTEEWDYMNGVKFVNSSYYYCWMWRRYPTFFDTVLYSGTTTSPSFPPQTLTHNLGAVPEMMIVKARNGSGANYPWTVYHKDVGNTKALFLDTGGSTSTGTAYWNNTTPTATQFTVGGGYGVNELNKNYCAWLFSSVDGICKVGSYTGNGSASGPTVDCGFSNGLRFIIIKRVTNASNDNWIMFDTERGLSSGNDNYLAIDNTDAEFSNVDWIDPTSAGFQVVNTNSGVNASGDTYIFYAIAA